MNNFDVEIKCNDQIFKAVAKLSATLLLLAL
jgi:hypothetical protein